MKTMPQVKKLRAGYYGCDDWRIQCVRGSWYVLNLKAQSKPQDIWDTAYPTRTALRERKWFKTFKQARTYLLTELAHPSEVIDAL